MLSRALSLYCRHFAALVLTCAVALLPANLLAAGAVVFGLATLGAGGVAETRTHTQDVHEKQQELRESPPADPEAQQIRARQLGRQALEGGAAFDARQFLRSVLPVAYASAIIAALLLAGLFFAHAAVVPLVLDLEAGRRAGPAHAWAVVAPRMGALLATGLLGALLVAVGAVFFIVPGVLLAASFSLAAPIAVLEGVSGRAALERSWRLLRGHWGRAAGLWALILVFWMAGWAVAALVPAGPLRPLASALVRVLLYPLPLAGLVLLYREPETQYMRRSSAPG